MNPEVDVKTWDHTEEETYGLGGVRTPAKFYETFGIDVVKKTIEKNMCQFVDGGKDTMESMFKPFMRKDGMGIDYSQITYKFKDPEKKAMAPGMAEELEQAEQEEDPEEEVEEEPEVEEEQ
jgi:hypothetical protein